MCTMVWLGGGDNCWTKTYASAFLWGLRRRCFAISQTDWVRKNGSCTQIKTGCNEIYMFIEQVGVIWNSSNADMVSPCTKHNHFSSSKFDYPGGQSTKDIPNPNTMDIAQTCIMDKLVGWLHFNNWRSPSGVTDPNPSLPNRPIA